MEIMETYELEEIMRRVSQALNELAHYYKRRVIVVVHDTRKPYFSWIIEKTLFLLDYRNRKLFVSYVGTMEDVKWLIWLKKLIWLIKKRLT